MKSHVFLTPMSPDGKPGVPQEIVYEDARPQQFAEPVSYASNDDLGKLRHDVHTAAAALRHAKSKKVSAAEIAKLQTALEAARAAAGQAHYQQQQERARQRTGGDHPFVRQSEDSRQFAEIVSYAENDYDGNDTSGRTFDDQADDELEAKILAAVKDLEEAQAAGASPAKMEKLAAALKVLRDQLPNPQKPFGEAPPRKSHITQPAPTQPTGQAARQVKTNDRAGWATFLAALDAGLAKRRKALQATHSADVCCQGKYLCPRCKAKAAAA